MLSGVGLAICFRLAGQIQRNEQFKFFFRRQIAMPAQGVRLLIRWQILTSATPGHL
jgi:hypothetical protein